MRRTIPAAVATAAMALVALVALWTQQALLVPSLGSAVFGQVFSPRRPGATPYSTAASQVAGAVGGFAGVLLAGAATAPAFMTGHVLTGSRVLAVTIAVAIAATLQLALRAPSPAGAATALVVAVGAETPDGAGAARLFCGILLVTALGELGRRLVLRLSDG